MTDSLLKSASLLLALLAGSGCQSWQKSHQAAIQHFSSGELQQSRTQLHKSLQSVRAEQNVLKLDQAILDLAAGDPLAAENQLRTVRSELEHLAQSDLTEQTTSFLTDDRAVAFSGREYEQRMALNMLLLSSLLSNGQDAFAYALQAHQISHERREFLAEAARQQADPATAAQIVPAGFQQTADQTTTAGQTAASTAAPTAAPTATTPPASVVTPLAPGGPSPDTRDQTLALAAYLSAAVQSESPTRAEETDTALRDLHLWHPQFAQQTRPDTAGEIGTRCQPGHGTLHVVVLAGRAPEWVPETAAPTSAALLIADRILSVTGKHTLPPTIAPVKIARPQPVTPVPPLGLVNCQIRSGTAATARSDAGPLTFHPLVDLNAVAEADYQAHRDEELARAVTRRVVKKGAVYAIKEAQKIHRNTAVDLAVNVAGIAWEALEKPDTRSWHLLPARIDVARTELPAGQWTASLACRSSFAGQTAVNVPVHIESGRNTWVVCFLPENSLTGQILVGGADSGQYPVAPTANATSTAENSLAGTVRLDATGN